MYGPVLVLSHYVEVSEDYLSRVGSLLLPCGSQGSHSGCQPSWQVPWPPEPSLQHQLWIVVLFFVLLIWSSVFRLVGWPFGRSVGWLVELNLRPVFAKHVLSH